VRCKVAARTAHTNVVRCMMCVGRALARSVRSRMHVFACVLLHLLSSPLFLFAASSLSCIRTLASVAYVFLGGSCDPTTWRADLAVPELLAAGIAFFNPQISDWAPELIALEASAKERCLVLLFVIDGRTRAIASMLEATEYILSGRSVVLVIEEIPANTRIDGDLIEGRQQKDLNRARAFLCDIAARHQRYCDVFDSVENVRRERGHRPREQ
jgi:hypothetical protein